jgi:hypothetical protein
MGRTVICFEAGWISMSCMTVTTENVETKSELISVGNFKYNYMGQLENKFTWHIMS